MNQGAEVYRSSNWLDVLGLGSLSIRSRDFSSPLHPSGSGANVAICQWVQGVLTQVYQAQQEADLSSPSCAEVNVATYPYVFIAWCLFKHDSFMFLPYI
jgi:hypothetical protein